MCSRLSCEVRWIRPVRRWIVKNSGGSTSSETSVRNGSSNSMKTTMITRRKNSIAHVRMPKIITSWMLLASLIARQMLSPTD